MISSKSSKGITLISLVVTIVVLIILVGVSINLLLGENGIITKAREAKTLYETSANTEHDQLVNVESVFEELLGNNTKKLEKHPDQTKTNDIGVDANGNVVNLDLWNYVTNASGELILIDPDGSNENACYLPLGREWENSPLYAANSNLSTNNVVCLEYIVTAQGDTKYVTELAPDGCFANTEIQNIKLPKTLVKIPKESFNGCYDLKELHIPSSVQILENNVFENFSAHITLKVDSQAVVNKLYSGNHIDYGINAVLIKQDYYDQTKPQIIIGFGCAGGTYTYRFTQIKDGYAEYVRE